jgi:hypothetical protein
LLIPGRGTHSDQIHAKIERSGRIVASPDITPVLG